MIQVVSAMPGIVAAFTSFFAPFGTSVTFGYRERAKQINQGVGGANRIVILPGDPNGGGGKMGTAPKDVGLRDIDDPAQPADAPRVGVVRAIASWERQFSISIWAADEASQRDELLQAVAVEAMFERVVQCLEGIKGAGGPNLVWGSTTWTVPKETTHGSELIVGVTLALPLLDVPDDDLAFPDFDLKRGPPDSTP
jgi:hypothetical protein